LAKRVTSDNANNNKDCVVTVAPEGLYCVFVCVGSYSAFAKLMKAN